MDSYEYESEHRKKRRRREVAPRPLAARLTFDDSIKSDAAVVSHSLWQTLNTNQPLPGESHGSGSSSSKADYRGSGPTDRPTSRPTFVAISPSSPLHKEVQDAVWTLTEVQEEAETPSNDLREPSAWVKISPKSSACPSILKAYATLERSRHGGHIPKGIDIKALLAAPLALDTIYVTIEKGLLDKVDEIQNKFGGGFQQNARHWKTDRKAVTDSHQKPEDRLRSVVREALSGWSVVHAGDIIPLPLPAHPITHVRPPPAIAIECEPVSQGRISPSTKIVLIQAGSSQEKAVQKLAPTQPIIEESLEDTAEDTSNDQFFSAAEDKETSTASEADGDSDQEPTSDESDQEGSDDDSDSMEDMISLSAPGLPPQQAGTLSAMTSATPRPGDRRASGTHTPGSVYSSFSASTARAGNRPGKVFRTEPLLRKIPNELLHPKPQAEDDEDSFVFVDTSTLAKIGCFSGDWVRIEVSKNVSLNGFPQGGFAALRPFSNEDNDWRAVKIFGLSGLSDQKAWYAVDKTGDRRSSFSRRESYTSLTPKIYLSPVLLANMASVQFVKVGALPNSTRNDMKQGPVTSKTPPFAKEVSLLKLSTPMTTRRDLQTAIFSLLKRFFERRKRVLKRGDLIAVPVDEDLGKIVSSPPGNETDPISEDLVAKLQSSSNGTKAVSTAWFYVQRLDAESSEHESPDLDNPWGGVAIVDHLTVRLHTQAGIREQIVSDSIGNWTQYWLGLRSVPHQNAYRSDVVTTPAALPLSQKLGLETKLSNLIAASVSPRAISLGMPPLVILLHSSQRQVGKTYTAQSASSAVGVHTFAVDGHDLLSENASTTGGGDVKTEGTLKARAETALSCGSQQTAIMVRNIDVLTAARMQPALQEIIDSSRVLIATTSKIDDVPDGIRSLFTHEFEISAPNEHARELILRNACLSSALPLSPGVNLKNLALQTAALVAGDLVDVVDRASLARSRRLQELADSQSCGVSDIVVAGGQSTTHLLPVDFTSAISAARSTFSDAIGAPKIPTVTWDDVGGLASQKDAIMETISLPLTHPELFANGIRKRSGILFYGPPGTGKTLLAKAIATEFSLNFFSVKGPELLNMYIGESEANVRRVFQRARDARPCVVFFDELDSVAPKRGNQGDSGGVMDRIVSQLLAELDGMSSSSPSADDDPASASSTSSGSGVFVIGATNRPDLLDPALLRPGRFDKMLYLGVADSHDSQVTILRALTRKFTLAPSVDLARVAKRLPFTYTGADLYALCSDAMLKAITRKTQAVDEKVRQISKARGEEVSTGYFFDHLATAEDTEVTVNEEDFARAQDELVGSVSRKELDHFERIRGLFEEQDISAGSGVGKLQKQEQITRLPLRPTPPTNEAEQFFATPPQHPSKQPAYGAAKQPGLASLHGMHNLSNAKSAVETKGKGKAAPAPQRDNSKSHVQRIGNPDSGASSSDDMRELDPFPDTDGLGDADVSAAGESDFGISNRHLGAGPNGRLMNGDIKGKGKGKSKSADFHDGDEGEDEGLYD